MPKQVFFAPTDTIKGRTGYTTTFTDDNDYYKSFMPNGGTLKLYFDYTNSSGSSGASIYVYVYNSNQTQIGSNFKYNQPMGVLVGDSLILECRDVDTVYIRITTSACFSYSLRHVIEPPGPNDIEPNNSFGTAQAIQHMVPKQGRIGLAAIVQDVDDYYKAYMPFDGTIKLYTTYNSHSSGSGANFYVYVYNGNQNQIGSLFKYNQPKGVSPTDTVSIFCRAQDTVYFRINSNTCFSYTIQYEVIPHGPNNIEPNNNFAQATVLNTTDTLVGLIGNAYQQFTDSDDYFKSYMPHAGTVKLYSNYTNTSNSNSASFYIYAYNANFNQIGSSFLYNQAIGQASTDTLTLYCRAQDTIYFRLSVSACFSYSVSYKVIGHGPVDAEPNNNFTEATSINAKDTIQAVIGNNYASWVDGDDYIKTYMPTQGTFKLYTNYNNTSGNSNAFFYMYVYNGSKNQIAAKFLYNRPLGVSPTDTLTIHCRAQDTVYVRHSSNSCFSYDFWYEVETHGQNDVEPNNNLATATALNLSQPIHGRIGNTGSLGTDDNDYYKFYNPTLADLHLNLDLQRSQPNSSGAFYIYLYNSSGNQVYAKFYYNVALDTLLENLVVACLPADTFYLRFNVSGCFSYNLDLALKDNQPVAKIKASRMGNTFGFVADVTNTNQVTWNFGDGTTSNLRLPVKDFDIGAYQIVLEARNTACNLIARDTLNIEVEGIEYYTPHKAATDEGLGFVSMRIFGGGLDTNAVVTITRGSTVLTPFQKGSPSRNELNLLFDLKDVPFGLYDVSIALSGGSSYSFPGGMDIFADKPGFDIVANITGPTLVRTSQWNNYTLSVSNDRARLANSVVACIVVPEGVETNIKEIITKRTGKFAIDEDAYNNELTIPLDYFNATYFDGTFNPKLDTFTVDLDAVYEHIDSLIEIKIDSLFDVPYRGTVYHLQIPMIAGEGSFNINFKAKSTSNGNRSIIAYAWPYNMRKNPTEGEMLDYIHDGGMQAAALAEYAPHPALRAVGKSAGYVDIGSKVAFTEFFDWYYGVNNADADFYAEQSLALGGELAGNAVPFGKKYEKGLDQVKFTKNRLQNAAKHIKLTEDIVMNAGLSPTMAKQLSHDLEYFTNFLATEGKHLTAIQKQAAMDAAKNYFAKQGINLTVKQLQDLLNGDDVETTKPKIIDDNPMNSVTSFDPNEIYGPEGFTANRYLKKGAALDYLVMFENVDTALAAAQVVRVELQLDPNIYDVKRTVLGDISIAGNTYFFEANRSTFFRDIDLRPANDVIVRINADVDTITGKIVWLFTSLDPLTMDILTNPLGGFLPPNVNFPEGEGSVSFTTFMKESITQSDTLKCFAEIFFDENESIVTGTWKNIIDQIAPTTSVNPTVKIENGNEMVLGVSGNDNQSGLESYWLHFKMGNGNWNTNPLPTLFGNEIRILGTVGETYQFYIIGRDSTGNWEQKTPTAEATAVLSNSESDWNPEFTLFPNPYAQIEALNVLANGNFADADISIFNAFGQAIYTTKASFVSGVSTEINIPQLAAGAYFIHFKTSNGKTNAQKLIVIK